jgi:hypothetical protein
LVTITVTGMPRRAGIDAAGAIHHIIIRGIERRKIFRNDSDRSNFVERLEKIVSATHTACLGWALIPNHAFGGVFDSLPLGWARGKRILIVDRPASTYQKLTKR